MSQQTTAEIFGTIVGGDGPLQALREVLPDVDRYAVDFFYGDIYRRGVLDIKMRELITVVALAATGTAPAQLRTHIGGALNLGWSRQEIAEALLQVVLAAGFPAALNGLAAAGEVFAARGPGAGSNAPRG
jgi:4-carboxymuconolactone decarboxylase